MEYLNCIRVSIFKTKYKLNIVLERLNEKQKMLRRFEIQSCLHENHDHENSVIKSNVLKAKKFVVREGFESFSLLYLINLFHPHEVLFLSSIS